MRVTRTERQMLSWKNQCIDLLNEGGFQIIDPGPLHAPINKFTIRRDEHLALILDTEAAAGAKSTAPKLSDGTARFNTDKAELTHISGAKATFSGVQTISVTPHADPIRETARVHQLSVTLLGVGEAAYTIEWLENLPAKHIWPDTITTIKENSTTQRISLDDDGITLHDSDS